MSTRFWNEPHRPGDGLSLEMIANRGVKVWPDGSPETFCTDDFRCRFMGPSPTPKQVIDLLGRVAGLGGGLSMRRVVVTGLGVVSPNGMVCSTDLLW